MNEVKSAIMQVTYFLNGPMPSLLELVSLLNFLFSSFSILINFSYKSVGYLELRYLELSLCWTFFSLHSVIFGLFLIRYLEHSNEIFEWIILFISGSQMLITVFTKLCPEVCSFFFFNIVLATTCKNSMEKVIARNARLWET